MKSIGEIQAYGGEFSWGFQSSQNVPMETDFKGMSVAIYMDWSFFSSCILSLTQSPVISTLSLSICLYKVS